MKISKTGLDLILSFEGLHKKIGPGKYASYRCPAGVWTIYAGCTEGIREGMVWTEAQGREAFAGELAKHEAAVARLVTVDLNQNQRDALISLSYNIGFGALGRSALLRKLNAGDFPGAQAEFMKWNKAGGKQLRGLSRRRAAEAELFAARTESEAEKVEDVPVMPQAVDAPTEPMLSSNQKMMLGAGAGGAAVPNVPDSVTSTISNAENWTSMGRTAGRFASAAVSTPLVTAGVVLLMALIWFGPRLWERFRGQTS